MTSVKHNVFLVSGMKTGCLTEKRENICVHEFLVFFRARRRFARITSSRLDFLAAGGPGGRCKPAGGVRGSVSTRKRIFFMNFKFSTY